MEEPDMRGVGLGEELIPAPVTTYSYSVIPNPFGYYFRIREKGEIIYFSKDYGRGFRTHLDATRAAQEWIKEQEELEAEKRYKKWVEGKEEPKPEYTYTLEPFDPPYDKRWAYQIYKKGEKEYWNCEDTKAEAEQAAQEWIKANTNPEKEG
jgi:hypothetical protein